jgi:glycine cleavage system H protein
MSQVPENLKYTKSHEWIKSEADYIVVGITDFAQSELGDIVYLDLPKVGRKLQLEEIFGTVESVKTVSDLYAPVSGEVIEINEELVSKSENINSDPFGKGWLIKIKPSEETQPALMSAEEYKSFISN